MEFRVLQYFLAVVREGNISRAAESLHVTQPTLSRQLAGLEEELGTQLFVRGKRLALTDAGVLFCRRAQEVAGLVEKIEQDFASQEELAGVISIGSGGLSAFSDLLTVVKAFQERHPKVRFRFHSNSADYIKEELNRGLLDFGLLLEPVEVDRYAYLRMKRREVWGLLVYPEHPLAARPYVTREDLRGMTLVGSDRLAMQKELQSWLGGSFEDLDIIATYNIITGFAGLVEKKMACAFTVRGAVTYFDDRRLLFKPLEPELSCSTVLAWKRFDSGFGAAAGFLEMAKSML